MPVEKRNGVWYVRFQHRGRTVRRSAGKGASRAEAVALEKQLRREARSQGAKTCSDALLQWLETDAPVSMRDHIRMVRPYIEGLPIPDAVAAASRIKAEGLAAGLSPLTVNRRLSVVRRLLNLCFKWGWIDQPLGQRIELLSERNSQRHFYLTPEELGRLLSAITTPVARDVATVAAYTGLRRGEILALEPSDWADGHLYIRRTKGGKPRRVPVLKELHPLMERLPFRISISTLHDAFNRARTRAQLPHIRFHDLRHTFASMLIADSRVPVTVVRDLLGHSSLAVTDRYSHLRTEALQDAVSRLEPGTETVTR